MNSDRLRAYLSLERAMLDLDAQNDPLADGLRDAMDPRWYALTDAEHAALDARDFGEGDVGRTTPGPHVEHLWTVVCRTFYRGADGLFTMDGLIDSLKVADLSPEPVLAQFECCVASQWRRNEDPGVEFQQRLMFQYQSDVASRVQVGGPDRIRVVERHLQSVINVITALPLRGYGQYFFVLQRLQRDVWEDVAPTAGLWVHSDEMLRAAALPPAMS